MIVVECNLDEYLIKSLGFPGKRIKHEGGKGKVLEKVRKGNSVIGLIDADPESPQPSDILNYETKESLETIELLFRKGDSAKRLIRVNPYLEQWLLNRARKSGISPQDYGVPEEGEALHSIPHPERTAKFRKFLEEIIKNDEEVRTLKSWLKEELK